MLINFSVENWMSFQSRTTLSMIASGERQHGERVPRLKKYNTRVLPTAAIYGGNASGKTNLFLALDFVQDFVVLGSPSVGSLIRVDPFLLDSESEQQLTRFIIELFADDDKIYELSFAATKKAVLEEKLVRISSTSERVLYERKEGELKQIDKSLAKDQFLQFAFHGTRDNQLFLTNSVLQKVEVFKPVYDWFENFLVLIGPDARFGPFEQFLEEGGSLYKIMNNRLSQLDTGIAHLGSVEIPIENVSLPEELKTQLQEKVKEDETVHLLQPGNQRFVITRSKGKLVAKKLMASHLTSDGNEINFEMWRESDGTHRIIDLLPAFLAVSEQDSRKVFVIDELERSLHSLLTRQLLAGYLASCSPSSRAQLLFTTHDISLMDQSLFRRDEMWLTERDSDGNTKIFSFSDFKDVRYDKDVRKSYIQGRLGGVPRLSESTISCDS